MKKFLFVCFIFFSVLVNGQSGWTLDSCISYAKKNNPSIKLQLLSAELAKTSLMHNKMSFLPDVFAGASHSYNYGQTVDRYTNNFASDRVQSNNFYVGANVVLFNGFNLINSYKKGKLDAEIAVLDAKQATDDISLSIATAYLQILYALEMKNNAQKQLELTLMQVEKNKKMFAVGAISEGNLLTIEAQAASEESQLVNAENQYDMANLTLAQMLDIEDVSSFRISEPEINELDTASFLLIDSKSVFEYAEKNHYGLIAEEYRVQAAEKSLNIARSSRYPTLSLSGSIGTGYSGAARRLKDVTPSGIDTVGFTSGSPSEYVMMPSFVYNYENTPFKDQINENVNKSIGLQLNIPIFSRFNTNTAIKQAKINLKMAEINYQQKRMNLQKTVQQAYFDASAAYKKYLAAKKQVLALQQAFKYTEHRFDLGLTTPLDYNDAKNKLNIANSDMLQSKYDFIFRTKILDYYRGKELKL